VHVGYCPVLENFSASYCALKGLDDFSSCPNLQQLDVSFNQIESLIPLLQSLYTNQRLHTVTLNDNTFNYNIQPDSALSL
jgi:Leucine-rich repeat (LRR) protein